jgi:hypothetical protein
MAYLDITDQFHLRLGRIAHTSAQLDFNIGLALSWLGSYCGVDTSEYLNVKSHQLASRIAKLEEIVKIAFKNAPPEVFNDFNSWFDKARNVKSLRNNYMHARWGINPIRDDSEPYVKFTPLNWNMNPDQVLPETTLTFRELDLQIDEFKDVAFSFHTIFQKHSTHVQIVQ